MPDPPLSPEQAREIVRRLDNDIADLEKDLERRQQNLVLRRLERVRYAEWLPPGPGE